MTDKLGKDLKRKTEAAKEKGYSKVLPKQGTGKLPQHPAKRHNPSLKMVKEAEKNKNTTSGKSPAMEARKSRKVGTSKATDPKKPPELRSSKGTTAHKDVSKSGMKKFHPKMGS